MASKRLFKEPVVLLPNPPRLNFDAVREALARRENNVATEAQQPPSSSAKRTDVAPKTLLLGATVQIKVAR